MGWPKALAKLKRNVLSRTEAESQVDAELRALCGFRRSG
jgi:hypothetical protein